VFLYQGSTGSSTQLEVGVSAPSSPTNLSGVAQITYATAGSSTVAPLSSGTYTGTAVTNANTTLVARLDGTLENGANPGTLAFQVAEAGGGTITIVRGSYCSVTTGN